jgi:hypothetical protein
MNISTDFKELLKQFTFLNDNLLTSNNNYELECIFKNLDNLTQTNFQNIYSFLYSSDNFVYQNDLNKERLDCRIVSGNFLENYRLSLNNIDDILKYCKTNKIENTNYIITEKKRVNKIKPIDLSNYPIRFNLKLENDIDSKDEENKEIIKKIKTNFTKSKKYYRYKKTYSFITKDNLFRIDLSLVKKSNTYSTDLYKSKILNQKPSFELEIELINKTFVNIISKDENKDIKKIINSMFNIIGNLLMIINNSIVLIDDKEKDSVLNEYLKLGFKLTQKELDKLIIKNPKKYFIGVQPVTLELKNLLKPSEDRVSILEDYNVTDKADGERNLIFISSSNKVYLINNRLSLKYTGLKSVSDLGGTLMDGEFITQDKFGNNINDIAVFDIYFYKNENISTKIFYKKDKIKKTKVDNEDDEKTSQSTSPNPIITRHHILSDIFSKKTNFKLEDKSNNTRIYLKEFLFSKTEKSFFKNNIKILNNMENGVFEYHTDGLIFTPNNLSVGSYHSKDETRLQGSWKRVFKWKPPEENTIDFLVRFIDKIEDDNKYMYCKLYVGYDENKEIKPIDILNHRFEDNVYGIKEFAECYLKITDELIDGVSKELIYTLDRKDISNGMIVEMSYDNNESNEFLKWKPHRIRYDKTELYKMTKKVSGTANDYSTALNVWGSIQYPVTNDIIKGIEEITEELVEQNKTESDAYYSRETKRELSLLKPMLDFHNYWIKNKFLYNRLSNHTLGLKSLFDIACGKGGDIYKWVNSGYKIVIGSDISKDNLYNINDGLYKRYNQLVKNNLIKKNNKNKKNIDMCFFVADASEKWTNDYLLNKNIDDEDSKKILKILTGTIRKKDINPDMTILLNVYDIFKTQFTAVSCMFAIHYMFKNENTLDNFVSNINMLLKKDGFFFGTCLDGFMVDRSLNDNKEVRGVINDKTVWLIEKNYDNYDINIPINNIGKKINVYMETINQKIEEYLVDYELLKLKLSKYDIKPLNEEDLKKIKMEDFKTSSGSFEEIYDFYKKNPKNKINKMDLVHKDYSFLNRWFIFKKY